MRITFKLYASLGEHLQHCGALRGPMDSLLTGALWLQAVVAEHVVTVVLVITDSIRAGTGWADDQHLGVLPALQRRALQQTIGTTVGVVARDMLGGLLKHSGTMKLCFYNFMKNYRINFTRATAGVEFSATRASAPACSPPHRANTWLGDGRFRLMAATGGSAIGEIVRFEEKDGKTLLMDTQEAIWAGELYKKLLTEAAPPGSVGFNWSESQTSFSQGKVAMWIDGIGFSAPLIDPAKSRIAKDVGFAPVPAGM